MPFCTPVLKWQHNGKCIAILILIQKDSPVVVCKRMLFTAFPTSIRILRYCLPYRLFTSNTRCRLQAGSPQLPRCFSAGTRRQERDFSYTGFSRTALRVSAKAAVKKGYVSFLHPRAKAAATSGESKRAGHLQGHAHDISPAQSLYAVAVTGTIHQAFLLPFYSHLYGNKNVPVCCVAQRQQASHNPCKTGS